MYSNYSQLPATIATLTSGTETAYLSTPVGQPVPPASQGVVIRGYINATGGATGGGWSIKCRRGQATITGTQVGNTQTVTFAATTTMSIPFSFVDLTPPAGQQGSYTVTVTAAGSNGSGNDGAVEVYVPVEGADV